jgi:hypothetical protein
MLSAVRFIKYEPINAHAVVNDNVIKSEVFILYF